jgi:hypothetical protein
VHPIERLRYVARSHGADAGSLVRETAGALRGLGLDPAGLVVACRRIVERHPSSGPLWWLCAHVLTSPDPLGTARELALRFDDETLVDVLVESLPDDATVCLAGWNDIAGEAVARRGDITVLVIDVDDNAAGLARALHRRGQEAEVVPVAGAAAAARASDLVLLEAEAAAPDELLAVMGARPLAAAAYVDQVPVWALVGTGRVLPSTLFAAVCERVGDRRVAWDADVEPVPLALVSHVARPDGVIETPPALDPECPPAPELLRVSPM